MRSNKIILAILILSMIALIFSGCGGGGFVTPPIPDNDDSDSEEKELIEVVSKEINLNEGGIIEITDPENELFGLKLIIEPITKQEKRSVDEVINIVLYLGLTSTCELPEYQGYLITPIVIQAGIEDMIPGISKIEIPYNEKQLINSGVSKDSEIHVLRTIDIKQPWEELSPDQFTIKDNVVIIPIGWIVNYPGFYFYTLTVDNAIPPDPNDFNNPLPGDLLYKFSKLIPFKINEGWLPGHVGIYVGERYDEENEKKYNVIEALLSGVQRTYYEDIQGFGGDSIYLGAREPEYGLLHGQRNKIVALAEAAVGSEYAAFETFTSMIYSGLGMGEIVKGPYKYNCVGLAEGAYEYAGVDLVSDYDEGNQEWSAHDILTPAEQWYSTVPATGVLVQNISPEISSLEIAPESPVGANSSVSITCTASDQDGDLLTYIWDKNGGTFEGSTSELPITKGKSIIWVAPNKEDEYKITCRVIDNYGGKDEKSINISVGDVNLNHPPVISDLSANPSSLNISETTTITCTASDEDVGDTIYYTWGNNGGSFEGDTSGSSVTWRAPSTEGKYTVTCEVSDREASDSEQVDITVNDTGTSNPVHNLTKDTYYDTIQAALDAADNNNTIEVSEGTYNENINFLGKNITLRSTNPNDPSVVVSTIIDGGGNGSVVIFAGGETSQAVLRGLTIQNGNSEPGAGGGIMINNSSPTISGNIIRWNNAHSDHGGGGIFIAHSASPIIENNTIDGNQGGFGGGIYVGDNSSPTIRNNTIKNNSAEIHRGGGIFISGSSSPTIQDNSLSDNSAQYGGGICIVENSSGEISNNYFTLNIAQYGGGIFCGEDSDPIIKQNEFYENSATSFGGGLFIGECVVNNNVISGNTAQTGGGIFVWESSPTISDNTINGNTTTMNGGGIYVRSNSHPTINNNIISLNTTTRDGGGLYIDGSSSVKTTNGSTWTRQNTPPNTEATNTYFDNTHGNPLDYTEGADVYMVGAITPPPDVESPTVITVKATNITETSARLYGNITDTGGENADQRGFALQDLTEGLNLNPIYEDGSFPTGEYSLTVSNLISGHHYRFGAYAENSHGGGYGEWIEFTTSTDLVQAEITNIGSPSGDLIDPFEFDKWYDAIIYLHKSNTGTGSGTIEVKPKPDSGVIYNPTVKYFDYNDGTSGGSRGFDYKFVGSGTTRQLTFELYDQATGNKLDEYTSEALHLMQPDPNLDYIESVPSSTSLQVRHWFNFSSDYVIKAHFDDGHIETWSDYSKFLFETSNENVVYVGTEIGNMMGIGPGTATITITYKQDTSKKAYLTVNVHE